MHLKQNKMALFYSFVLDTIIELNGRDYILICKTALKSHVKMC